MRNSVLEE